MTCNSEGGTHWLDGCECQMERVRRLEELLAERFRDDVVAEYSTVRRDFVAPNNSVLRALREREAAKKEKP